MSADTTPQPRPPLRGVAAALFRRLLPRAERDEVMADLAEEYADRLRRRGAARGRAWLWRQLIGSLPALLRRTWWRGWTGFEPQASALQPGGPVLESWIIDLRYSARRLAARPTYALLAVLTLALGAAGTAAVFSVARALLLDPLPVAREAEVGVLWFDGSWTEQEFLFLRPQFPGFRQMAAYRPLDTTLEVPGAPIRLERGIGASAELFDVLGRGPLLGRAFRPGDDRPGAEPIVVLSHALWRDLGSDPAIVGRQLKLGGAVRTVVGVMPAGFWFPTPDTRVWTAMPLSESNRAGMYTLVGRVAAGASVEHMEAPLRALTARLAGRFRYPRQWDKTQSPAITSLRETLVGDVRPGVLATLAAVGLILLIACVNVAALMLGQVSGRATEFAVRSALGAGKQRLLQQVVAESLLLGLAAGATGALLAAAGFQVLVKSLPLGALAATATLDWTLFLAATLVALMAAGAVALIPSLALARGNPQASLSTVRTAGVSARGGRLEAVLVVGQISLAVVLAVGAALLIRSLSNLHAIDPGFRVDGKAVIDITMPRELPEDTCRRAVIDLIPALAALPNVERVAATEKLPLRGSGDNWGIEIEGKPELSASTTAFRIVTRDYFKTLGVPIRRGRGFEAIDRPTTEQVTVINEALAAKYFPGEEPIGRVIHTGRQSARIVGVVANLAEAELTDAPVPARYVLLDQVPFGPPQMAIVLAARNPQALASVLEAARRVVASEGRFMAVEKTTTMRWLFEDAVGPAGQLARLLALLASLALLLGAVGVYGMVSHSVTRRTRDYGIRMALGLAPAKVVSEVLRRGASLVAAGSVVGILIALVLTRFLSSLLYGVRAADPVSLAGAVSALLLVGCAAAYIPARRAARTDPVAVLRQQ